MLFACSPTVTHELAPRNAEDYTAPRSVTSGAASELEPLAVLLVPTNTSVVRPNFVFRRPDIHKIELERYVGPARVFLPPGKRSYVVRIRTAEGVVELRLEAEFEAGKRYELDIIDDEDEVAFELFELHPRSYGAVYPND